ncbi:Methyltransferase small domain-containing protein [Halopseudomonas sabulinigri]|uniref:Methyltransferase small domain-containing protein n=1 Tax=Halopseudomonas sabulinigri TaxID=472181 RepID=A0A1H1PDQ5_9GAMM|nr:methyltransferase [Halopseudomonas sabulinigri]SDS09264.1 Methyltransferase small domain-containing protein [Halopseudomonas sabulinigri]
MTSACRQPVALSASEQALVSLAQYLKEQNYRFVTCTPATHARVNARPENAEARELAGVFGWSRPFSQGLLGPILLQNMRAADVLVTEQDQYRSRVRCSSMGSQLLLHSAYPTNEPDAVFFGPDSYRFVSAIEDFLSPGGIADAGPPVRRAADIGCGAGPGALSIALARPASEVLALDINPRALSFSCINATAAGVCNVHALHSDLLKDVEGGFDLIVANPPYMADPECRAYRNGGGQLGLGLTQAIVKAALPRLTVGGTLLLYSGVAITSKGDPLYPWLQLLLNEPQYNWHYQELDPDVFGEELEEPGYENVERIAAILVRITRKS